MARTIKDIADSMKAEFVGSEALRTHYGLDDFNANVDYVEFYNSHFSVVSVETCLIYIVATCANALEKLFDLFRKEVDDIVANERYGHKGWYERKAREFHYTDQTTQEEVYPITQVSCEEQNFGIKLKVAKGEPGSLAALEAIELTAFEYWMDRQKPAGIPIRYESREADSLWLTMAVFYDPVKMDAEHVNESVNDAIKAHLHSIDFNGVFSTTALVDDLQKLEWLTLVEIHEVHSRANGYQYESQIEAGTRHVPVSGWYELDEDNTQITAIPLL
jgi:hypothetical protein